MPAFQISASPLPPHTNCFALLHSVILHLPPALPFVRLHVGIGLCHAIRHFVRVVSLVSSIITYTQIEYYRPKKTYIDDIDARIPNIFCSYKIHS